MTTCETQLATSADCSLEFVAGWLVVVRPFLATDRSGGFALSTVSPTVIYTIARRDGGVQDKKECGVVIVVWLLRAERAEVGCGSRKRDERPGSRSRTQKQAHLRTKGEAEVGGRKIKKSVRTRAGVSEERVGRR